MNEENIVDSISGEEVVSIDIVANFHDDQPTHVYIHHPDGSATVIEEGVEGVLWIDRRRAE